MLSSRILSAQTYNLYKDEKEKITRDIGIYNINGQLIHAEILGTKFLMVQEACIIRAYYYISFDKSRLYISRYIYSRVDGSGECAKCILYCVRHCWYY